MSPWYEKTIKYTFIKNYLSIDFKNLLAISLGNVPIMEESFEVLLMTRVAASIKDTDKTKVTSMTEV